MSAKGTVLWSSVRRHYEMNLGTINEICDLFKVARATLYSRARREGWAKRRPGKTVASVASVASEASEVAVHSAVSGKKITSKIKNDQCVARPSNGNEAESVGVRESEGDADGGADGGADGVAGLGTSGVRSVGTRLYEVLEIKLAEIEDRIARGEQLSPEGNEREQRVIGNLIRNFDKLTEFNERRTRGAGKPGGRGAKSGGAGDGGDGAASDLSKLNAMQFREEIARRIEHFEKEWKT